MPEEVTAGAKLKTWLVAASGALAGARFPVGEGVTRVGRAPDNDIVLDAPDCSTVSSYHLELSKAAGVCRVRDLGSTNGTWIDGASVTEAELAPGAVLRLGNQGPEFTLVHEEAAPALLDRTIEVPRSALPPPPSEPPQPPAAHEELLSAAVARARTMRAHGGHGQTMTIMREVIEEALRHTRRRFRVVGYSLLCGLLVVSGLGLWRILVLDREKKQIDAHIRQLEEELQKTGGGAQTDVLLSQLDQYQDQAQLLKRNLLYRIGRPRTDEEDFVTRELRAVMAELGAEVYSVPPDFVERVNHYIEQDQGPDRPIIVRSLSEAAGKLATIRQILQAEQLPQDLAYIPIVESALTAGPASAAGAAGPWQFTAATARAYGLRVDSQVDERKDLVKSTRASCKYLRELILDFGTGSSIMLALAAYNSGTSKVKDAVSRTVKDPIKQRNFWYLYRARALPLETREYVPKVFAAILIGRNPRHFGF